MRRRTVIAARAVAALARPAIAANTQPLRFVPQAPLTSIDPVPMGRYMLRQAWSAKLTGLLKGPAPVFWNISKRS